MRSIILRDPQRERRARKNAQCTERTYKLYSVAARK